MKVAFVGCGKMAVEHARTIQSLGHEISYVYERPKSRSLDSFCAEFAGVVKCSNLEEMLSLNDCQAYIVTIPPEASQDLFVMFEESGKYFLIEKPGFLDVEKALIHLGSTKIVFGFNRRFYKSILELRNMTKNSQTLFSFRLSERHCNSYEDQVNLILNNSVHLLDLVSFLIPKSKLANILVDKNIGFLKASIYRDDIFSGDLEICFGIPVNSEISAFQFQKHYRLRPIEQLSISERMIITDPDSSTSIRLYAPDYVSMEPSKEDLIFKPGLFLQDSKFLEMVSLGSLAHEIEDLAGVSDVVSTLALAEQIIKLL